MPTPFKTVEPLMDTAGNLGIFVTDQVGAAVRKPLRTASVNLDEEGNIGGFFSGGLPSGGGTGTSDHALLTNRDASNQHPATAIQCGDGKSVQEHIDGLTAVLSGTYSEIKSLRDSSQLIPGNLYRITDYETIYVQPVTNIVRSDSSALFDVVLLATDKNRFAPEAWAAHTDRTQPSGSVITSTTPLHQWRLLYDIDNNSGLYAWATSTGKGVIYRLVDHLENDLPYDFYNVKYQRYKITDTTTAAVSLVGQYLSLETTKTGFTVDSGDYVDLLTFDWSNAIRINVFQPYMAGAQRVLPNNTFGGVCQYNTFGCNCYANTVVNQCQDNVFASTCCGNVFGELCNFNVFGESFADNIVVGRCRYNTFGSISYGNVFADKCEHNSFGNGCYNNTFGGNCQYNSFGNACASNTFAGECTYSEFGSGCYGNKFVGSCICNTFSTRCYDNTFNSTCSTSTFGVQFYSNVFDGGCSFNTFGTFCNRNNFGGDCYRNTFGDSFNRNTTGTGLLNFVQFLPGITSRNFSSKDIYDKAYNQTIQKKAPSGGVISVWFDVSNQQQVANL